MHSVVPTKGIQNDTKNDLFRSILGMISLVLLLLPFFASSACMGMSDRMKSGYGLAMMNKNDLVAHLERNHWRFISIPTADINPGAIISFPEEGFKVVGTLRDCFPDEVMYSLRTETHPAAIPELNHKYVFDAQGSILFANYFSAGPEFSDIRDIVFEIRDASIHSISEVQLNQKTRDHWHVMKNKVCGEQLKKMSTHVVTSVLSATDFSLIFKDSRGAKLNISNVNVGNYLFINSGVHFEDTAEGGLRFKKQHPLPFAFQSVPVDVPERRGKLEILQPIAHIAKGQAMTSLRLRNSGKDHLNWQVRRWPEKGFIVSPTRGYLKLDDENELVVYRTPVCVDIEKSNDMFVMVTETEQMEHRKITVEEECPSSQPSLRMVGTADESAFQLAEGERRFREGEFDKAVTALEKAEQLNPDLVESPAFKRVAGLVSYKKGDKEQALKYFKALASDQKSGHAYAAYLLAANENFPEARRELAKGGKYLEIDSWSRAEIFSTFNKPVGECHVPPYAKAILYRDEIAKSVSQVVGLRGVKFQNIFDSEARRMEEIDNGLSKPFAATVFCDISQEATVQQTRETAEAINAVIQKVTKDRSFDVRPRALLENTENRLRQNLNLGENIAKVLRDYASFMSGRLRISSSHLRANVFMLDHAGMLRIPEGLAFNMYDPEELSIRIPVGFGSTGIAFERRTLTVTRFRNQKLENEPSISLVWSSEVLEKGKELWESRKIYLPMKEMRKLTQIPAWIISVPIFESRGGGVLGILNVDCIENVSVFPQAESTCEMLDKSEYQKVEVETYYWSSRIGSLLAEN